MKSNTPFFPIDTTHLEGVSEKDFGISTRDYIAVQAMKALAPVLEEWNKKKPFTESRKELAEKVAVASYRYADALIEESTKVRP